MAKKKISKKSALSNIDDNAVLNRSAQSSALCAVAETPELRAMRLNVENFLKKNQNKMLVFIIGLLYCYGLRVSEVLNLSSLNVLGNYQLFIKGSKNSDDRIVYVVYGQEVYRSLLLNQYAIGVVYSRFWLYRELRKYGLYGYFGSNENASVTHLCRHIKVLSLKNSGVPRGTISKFIGHKSIKSLRYYEQEINNFAKD